MRISATFSLAALFLCACASGPSVTEISEARRDVRTTLQAHLPQFGSCYRALPAESRSGGRVVLRWALNEQGKVTSAAVDSAQDQIHNQALSSCLLSRLRGIHFPAMPEAATISYPFVFRVSREALARKSQGRVKLRAGQPAAIQAN